MTIEAYDKLDIYTKALRIRMIEQEIAARYPEQEMRCPVHLSIGQEANAVIMAKQLTHLDSMVSTHRGHAHYLAKGGSLVGLIGELYGKSIGCSRGFGGSMHLTDPDCNFVGSTSIVGGTIPVGVGVAFANKLKKKKLITAVCIGDAAIEEGVFHESANFAGLHKLPVVFFVENNLYSCFTHISKRQPERNIGASSLKFTARAHGLRHLQIHSENYYDGYKALGIAINSMRKDENYCPLFVEIDTYRFVEHCGPSNDDHLNYRAESEIRHATTFDPINVFEKYLRGIGFLNDDSLKVLRNKIHKEISEAFNQVKDSYAPSRSNMGDYLYA